ncbi:MAG: glycosyltransferase [Solirubrobacteraceae bacterium]
MARILVLSARAPQRGGRGDQNRLALLLPYLAERHDVTLVTGQPVAESETPAGIDAMAVFTAPASRIPGVLQTATTLPVQTSWFTPPALWRKAVGIAQRCDVALVVTSRSLRGPLPVPTVVDHMDAFSYNMRERARGPENAARRAAARWEATRSVRWEQDIARFSAARIASSEGVKRLLPEGSPISVVPAAWEGDIADDPPGHVRDLDVVLSGNMRYPPNREAALRLVNEILPRVRELRPGVRAAIVGRNAADYAAELGAGDVELHADVPDLHAFLRRAKIAVAPIRGAGSPFKVLEAAACGAALVGSGWGLRAYGIREVIAEGSDEFADAIVRLLSDDAARGRAAAAGRDAARAHRAEGIAARFEEILVAAAAQRQALH